jgi:hypothetical protein
MAGLGRNVESHFERSSANVAETYEAIVKQAKRFGRVREDPKKTSIHLARRTAFAGVAVQRAALILTVKSDRDIGSARVRKREQVSANRWHIEVRLTTPADVDTQVCEWLQRAYSLAG